MTEKITILITDASHPVTATVVESLRSVALSYEIVGVDQLSAQYLAGSMWVDHHYTVPAPDDKGYCAAILQICKKHNVKVVIPWTNDEAVALAKKAPEFDRNGSRLLTSSIEAIEKVVDKYTLMNNLRDYGFATPKFFAVDTIAELESAVRALGYPEKSVVVKPRNLSGARGFCLIDPNPDISKRGFSDSLPLSAFLEILRHLPTPQQHSLDLIAMEFLSGEDYSADVVAKDTRTIAVIPRLRLQSAGGVSSLGETVYNPLVSKLASDAVEKFGLNLNVNVQMKYRADNSGEPFIYDINPRISGTIVANSHAGINFVHMGIQAALGNPLPSLERPNYKHILMVRRWSEDCVDYGEEFPVIVKKVSGKV